MSEKLEALLARILSDNIKVVSFDIFDTLLVRPVIAPVDLFRIIGIRSGYPAVQFMEMRRIAEQEARKKKSFNIDDIKLEDIYVQFSKLFSITLDEAFDIMRIELEVEEKYLYPRYSLRDVFNKVLSAGKEVIITSDMYLPKEFLEKVLWKNGYTGYSNLYLSCEIGVAKGTGKIYQRIISDYKEKGILPSQIVHIGDNSAADVRQAKNQGIKAEHVPSTISIFKSKKEWNRLVTFNHKNADNTFLIGFLANKMFDDPFRPFASYSVLDGQLENLAYLTAPFLLSSTKWMLEDAIDNQVELILMAYRDGFIPGEIYNMLSKYYAYTPKIEPIYLSRKIRYFFKAKQENGLFQSLLDLSVNPQMSVEEFVVNRLLVKEESDKRQVYSIFLKHGYGSIKENIGKKENYLYFINEVEPFFQKCVKDSIEAVQNYCNSFVADNTKNVACFDIGYRGSVSRFLNDDIGISNIGYHFMATPLLDLDKKTEYNLKSYVEYGFNIPFETKILHALLEDIVSIQEGSAVDITEERGKFYIHKEKIVENYEIMSIQNMIIEYVRDFVNLFNEELPLLNFDHYLHFDLLVHFLSHPCERDGQAIRRLRFSDSGFITTNNDIYEGWFLSHFKMNISNNATAIINKSGIKSRIYHFLEKRKLLPYARKIYYLVDGIIKGVECRKSKENKIEELSTYTSVVDEALKNLSNNELLSMKKNIIVIGDMVSFDKGICNYLNSLSDILWREDYNMLLLSEATLATLETTKKRIGFYSVKVPEMLGKNQYKKNKEITIPEEVRQQILSDDCLLEAKDNWTMRHKDMTSSYAEMLCICIEKYYTGAFKALNPTGIIMWNQFHALHHIVEGIAKRNNIPIVYMEFGSLPGTFTLENLGQMGESYPSVRCEEFVKNQVSSMELTQAEMIWGYLKSSRLNRNVQKSVDRIEDIIVGIDKSKPIVFVAGQNDFESGIYPYTEHSKKYHSPIFKSSDESILYLSKLADKNGWNLLYKPHPIMSMLGCVATNIPSNVIIIEDIDINDIIDFADVTITILSQTGYISVIREKPTVMLGYTQLRGKNCTYEAYTKEKIEEQINKAIENGFTTSQKEAFKVHIAQMLKYYLYDDLLVRETRYGKPIEDAATYILDIFH